jgi:hypothetical protein
LQAVPLAFTGYVQAPVAGVHAPAVWHWSGGGHTTGLPVQMPPWHASPVVQALPSLHALPSALLGFEQPVAGLHVPATWHWSIAAQVTAAPPVQTPAWHVSPAVQALPSLQAVPLALAAYAHTPVPGLQTPATWHWSGAAHATAAPVHTPAWQVSPVVHALPSLQAVPSGWFGFEQPVAGLQTPAAWHWSTATQVTAAPPVQTPAWHVSLVVQTFPSLQAAPLTFAGALMHWPSTGLQLPARWH